MPLLFADDNNQSKSGKNGNQLQTEIGNESLYICHWLKINKLSLNIKTKNQFMIRTTKKSSISKY